MATRRLLRWIGVISVVALIFFVYRSRHAETDQSADAANTGAIQANKGNGKHHGRRAAFQGPVPVRVVAAQLGDMDQVIEALGTVIPLSTATVRSRVQGLVEQVPFKEGQWVKKGDLLAEIDPTPFRIQVKQAEGAVLKDQAQLQNAQIDLKRYQALATQESGSVQQRDTQAALVKQLEGTLKVDEAALENARVQLGYTRVIAPISGRIGLRQLDPGNLIGSGDTGTIGVITQLSPITVVFSIPQNKLSLVLTAMQNNQALKVKAYDRDAATLRAIGTLMAVDNQIDTTTGTVKLKARFDNQDGALFPDQFVNAGLSVAQLKNVVVLPVAAVQHGAPGSFVYVVKADKTVSMRVVTEGLSEDGRVIIAKGLAPGEQVVIEGVDNLNEGAKVTVVQPGSAPGDKSGALPDKTQVHHGGHHHPSKSE